MRDEAPSGSSVLTLVEDHELDMLGVPALGSEVRARGMAWYHLPIVDVAPPDERIENAWCKAGPEVREVLQASGRVLVHCRGGLGRAGTVAASLLVELGAGADDAIRRVRTARLGAKETSAQERYVRGLGAAYNLPVSNSTRTTTTTTPSTPLGA